MLVAVARPHREFLAVRGLAQRGNLAVQDWHSDTFRETWALEFLARLGDNGLVWNVLSFWRDADDIEDLTLGNGDVVRVYE